MFGRRRCWGSGGSNGDSRRWRRGAWKAARLGFSRSSQGSSAVVIYSRGHHCYLKWIQKSSLKPKKAAAAAGAAERHAAARLVVVERRASAASSSAACLPCVSCWLRGGGATRVETSHADLPRRRSPSAPTERELPADGSQTRDVSELPRSTKNALMAASIFLRRRSMRARRGSCRKRSNASSDPCTRVACVGHLVWPLKSSEHPMPRTPSPPSSPPRAYVPLYQRITQRSLSTDCATEACITPK